MSSAVEKRYAHALFGLAKEKKALDSVHQDMQTIHSAINQSIELKSCLENPIFPPEVKTKILEKIFKKHLQPLSYNFVLFLQEKGRLYILPKISDAFEQFYLEDQSIIKIKISSTTELTKTQLSSVSHHLKLKFRKEIDTTVEIDPTLVGGIRIQVEDTIYDYSIRTQLQTFKEKLITV